MNSEPCRKVWQKCAECWAGVTACFTHDEYFVCPECGGRELIDKAKFNRDFNLIFKKAIGKKPDKPENN